MKSIFYPLGMLCVLLCFSFQKARAQANTALSNLTATAVNLDLLPGADNSNNLGSAVKGWKQLYINNAVFMGGSKFISYGNTLGLGITAVGNNALAVNSGGFANTGIGFYSLAANTNGNANAAIGTRSLQANTTGSANMAMGYFSLYSNKTGNSNVAIGVRAMLSSVSGSNQVAIGDSSLFNLNGGLGFNTAIGSKSMYSNTTGSYNTGLGYQSLYSNTTSNFNTGVGYQALYSNTGDAFDNTATGYKSLYSNISGNRNIADGVYALIYNISGSNNVANGVYALQSNNIGNDNVAIGLQAAHSNATGNSNVAIGTHALESNTDGSNMVAIGDSALYSQSSGPGLNTAVGTKTLFSNTSGFYNVGLGSYALNLNAEGAGNTATGFEALLFNTSGTGNTAVGYDVLLTNETGTYNTALGTYADVSLDGLNFATVIGEGAIGSDNNQVTLGGTDVLEVRGAVNYSTYSDGRFKKDIKANVPGLEFIKELRPVTYHFNIHGINDLMKPLAKQSGKNGAYTKRPSSPDPIEEAAITAKEKKLYTGFVAQEVETAANKFNYDFSAIHKPQNEKDLYTLSYSDFVVPLVKAVQELSDSNETKNEKIDSLQARLQRLEDLVQQLVKGQSSGSVSFSDASLGQNMPNPFAGTTSINYSIPQNFGRAKLEVSDMSGRIIKTVMINNSGRGNLSVDASGLSSGVYNYTLYVDEKMISSKQMVLTK